MISQPEYEIMGKVVVCAEIQATTLFKLETDLDHYISKCFRHNGWQYTKVDTVNQIGFPDNMLLKGDKYLLIESKMLKTKKLTDVLENVKWQAGQVPWLLKALRHKQNYLLAIAKEDTLLILGESNNVRTMLSNTYDFRQL